MGAYLRQFKVARLNWFTATENVVNLLNLSLVLTPLLTRLNLDVSWEKAPEVSEVFFCMTANQDKALSSIAHNHIFLLKCWNDLLIQTCSFWEVIFRNWLQLQYYYCICPSVSLALTFSHKRFLFFCMWHLSVRKHQERQRLDLFLWKWSSLRSRHVMHSNDHVLCILNHSTVLCVSCSYNNKLLSRWFRTCCRTSQLLC